jgi:glutaredoxin
VSATVTLYSRAGCHLCDEARAALEELRRETPFDLQEIDIETDEALLRAHFERIPVILVDGVELCTFFLDAPRVRAAVGRRNAGKGPVRRLESGP